MYLTTVKSKGNYYLYLQMYEVREFYRSKKVNVYSFGRLEIALENMYKWKKAFNTFPQELLKAGCDYNDLLSWIATLESGRHIKTGRNFTATYFLNKE